MQVHGHFTVTKRNIKTGHTEHAESDNLILNAFHARLFADYQYSSGSGVFLHVGSGSNEPSVTDTAMTTPLWTGLGRSKSETEIVSKTGYKVQHTYIIPATSAYVGVMRELGLESSGLLTHALIKDAEGNPYEIQKTDLDEVTVIYELSVSTSQTEQGEASALRLAPYGGYISNAMCYLIGDSGWLGYKITLIAGCFRGRTVIKNDHLIVNRQNTVGEDVIQCIGNAPQSINGNFNTSSFLFSSIKKRLVRDQASIQGHYINYITESGKAQGPGTLVFPNSRIIAPQSSGKKNVGVGDGSTQDFVPPIPFWIEDTEKIFIDDVQLTRGVDYTCDYFNNLRNLVELFPSAHMFVIDGSTASANGMTLDNMHGYAADNPYAVYRPVFTAYRHNKKWTNNSAGQTSIYLSQGHPVTFEMPIDELGFDWSVDCLYFAAQYTGRLFTIECSNDLENWEIIAENISSNAGATPNMSAFTKVSFEKRTRRYWRVSLNSSSTTVFSLIIRRDGAPIHFTNPPADGAVITMGADLDRPYMDGDHILDVQYNVQY